MDNSKAYGVAPHSLFRNSSRTSNPACRFDRFLIRQFLHGIGDPGIRFTLWDGTVVSGSASTQQGVVVHNRGALLRLVANPLLAFGDDYSAGNIEVEGGLVPFLETVLRALARPGKVRRGARGISFGRSCFNNTLSDSRRNIYHHYDISNDFYSLWLDQEMLYTCAYFPQPGMSLEQAQIAKMELICRKLQLKGGERVIEAGCGWGGLARYMAKRYGAKVRAFNISHEQIAYARERARKEGIDGVEYVEDDYRNISGVCDAFVSVGMLEHVGVKHYRELGKVIDRTLSRTGLGLIHTIGQNLSEPMSPWISKRIFPGSYVPTVGEMMQIFEPQSFSILDLENLRLHYAKTLEHWTQRFEENKKMVAGMFDDSFVRAWRLYLASSIASFNTGNLQLFQVLFTRQSNNNVPWTRDRFCVGGSHDGNL